MLFPPNHYGLKSIYPLQKAFSTVGTPDYIAPEVLLKKGYGMECDWLVDFISSFMFKILLQLQVVICC